MFKRISAVYFMADSKEDLKNIIAPKMGAECFVIEDACEYKATSTGKWVKQAKESAGGDVDLSDYATEEYVDKAVESIDFSSYAKKENIPSVEGLVSEDEFNEVATNPILKAFDFTRNPSREDGQSIYLDADNPQTLQEALRKKGLGLYNVWISKGRSQDLPEAMITDNTSGRGFACVDLQYTQTNPERFIGYVVLFDKLNNMYYRFFNKGEAGPWMKVSAAEA